jgi:hypothetical protein
MSLDPARAAVAQLVRDLIRDLAEHREDSALAQQLVDRINADLTTLSELPAAEAQL